ncbi:type II toxin-antitoxin system RelE family toxin [Corynebacterium accolens]|uniref:type II toxin-antitoxin system RelE family toxin n=1 Tax=Corynebacterium accolens TaxID=38284 RepID=UPI00019C32BF|nr:type II toxin-antitoxin system RelE/ParE family toxin [Corynebacterium accolens]EEI15388.1 toxin-antitoxin system, toxin component, RelE family [Corynebacterium accolens ATCC 49725]EFM44105.1 toxin-antitoxin system, toxin component, RelE family [Corynebacterium accolens ATCC 49726]MDK4209838.1 type II toxin-antitoxin system RelE/ParE family toxin [Corynebacterium accolens]MDK8504004.1 type II toxin-antitoxin system RelE/ParE family toxin [Corynebacterium accolens]MDK8661251.1 type II toxin-
MQKQISKFLREVAELDDPRVRGKGLVADKSGLWRWRVGDYRVIVSILDEAVVVNVIDVGHRRNIYL